MLSWHPCLLNILSINIKTYRSLFRKFIWLLEIWLWLDLIRRLLKWDHLLMFLLWWVLSSKAWNFMKRIWNLKIKFFDTIKTFSMKNEIFLLNAVFIKPVEHFRFLLFFDFFLDWLYIRLNLSGIRLNCWLWHQKCLFLRFCHLWGRFIVRIIIRVIVLNWYFQLWLQKGAWFKISKSLFCTIKLILSIRCFKHTLSKWIISFRLDCL